MGNDRIITPFVISDELVEDDQVRTFYGGLRSGAGEYGRGGTLLTATPAEDVDAGQFWLTL